MTIIDRVIAHVLAVLIGFMIIIIVTGIVLLIKLWGVWAGSLIALILAAWLVGRLSVEAMTWWAARSEPQRRKHHG